VPPFGGFYYAWPRRARIHFDGKVTKLGSFIFLDWFTDRKFDIAKKNENLGATIEQNIFVRLIKKFVLGHDDSFGIAV
jgi:hypothetical protein